MVDVIEMSYLEALIQAEIEEQQKILLARNYHKGEQVVYLTDRVKEFLEMHSSKAKFRLNICQTVVTAVEDELNVIGFDTTETTDPNAKDTKKKQAQWAWQVWQDNLMDAVQDDVHEATLRDREAFVIVDWDNANARPRFTFHERYITTEAEGDGTGCWALYENDDINQPMRAAILQWTETVMINSRTVSRMRRTVYYPERIERWVYDSGWKHYEEEGKDWPTPWVDKEGKPLGIPVVHFKNVKYAPEAWEAIPIQDAVNKMLLDVLGSSDMGGFPIMKALGFLPTTDGKEAKADGSNVMKIKPMQWIGTTKSKTDADVGKIEASSVEPLMNTLIEIIALAAHITATPASRFIMTKQLAGADTIKAQDKPLMRKVEKRRGAFGNAWESVMVIARRLANQYGNAALDDKIRFFTLWKHSLSLDELGQKRTFLKIPLEQLWAEAGYTPEQIRNMKNTDEYQITLAIMKEGLANQQSANGEK